MMGGKFWTPEEDALLRKLWNTRGSLKVHARQFVDRNNNSLNLRGRALGLPGRMHLASDRYSIVRQKVEEVLEAGFVGTVNDIAAHIGELERETLRRVKEGHGTKYRISAWKRPVDFTEWIAVYSFGTEPDEPKPATQTQQQKRKRYNAKRRVRPSKVNPFATAISNVLGVDVISTKGQYKSRVYRIDEHETS